jgi:phosphoribosylamine--glycine ligase
LTEQGPMALEFNARLGDPEAQVLLMRLEDDLLPILASAVEGGFTVPRLSFRREAAACFVLASEGYPESPVKGEPIVGVEAVSREEGVQVFHASTGVRDGLLVANGGRVLSVCALGSSLRDALRRAYAAQSRIEWPSKILRRDIGRAVLERLEK